MKKALLTVLFLGAAFSVSAQAEDYTYPYLTFVKSNGSIVSVAATGLELSVSGTTLTAGSETFTLTDLTKMYFSTTDETTGVKAVTADNEDRIQKVYDLQGRRVTEGQMQKGIFIIKTESGTRKVNMK